MSKKDYLSFNYSIRIVADENGGWFVEIPELPGCMTAVEKFEDAYNAIDVAKEVWIEQALEDGYKIPLPAEKRDYSGKFSLRIPRSLHARLVVQSEEEGMSLNNYCTYLLSLGSGRNEAAAKRERVGATAAKKAAKSAPAKKASTVTPKNLKDKKAARKAA
jgi:predicted RNase H-like HicB family nuclease